MDRGHDNSVGLQRLGKNLKCYSGETIDIAGVLRDCVAAAQAGGWRLEEICSAPKHIFGLTRQSSRGTTSGDKNYRVYISTGIHGDEPAGPLAARQLLQENAWPPGLDLWLCPCLNPDGFALNRRENRDGLDLNRQYLAPVAEEIVAHIGWLKRQPAFDLCLCLHEDWESHGFYVYELNPDNRPSLAAAMIARIAGACPIDRSEVIEGWPARDGIIRPSADPRIRLQWPEAFFLLTHKTRLSYTLEAPSDFPLAARVAALVAGVNTALVTAQEHTPRRPGQTH
jgi:murein peptide amidase A